MWTSLIVLLVSVSAYSNRGRRKTSRRDNGRNCVHFYTFPRSVSYLTLPKPLFFQEEMPDATKPTESDAARISGDGTKYVDVKEYDKGNNFREPEAQTETEEQDVDIVVPEK